MWWAAWWLWGAFALALVILEILVPAYVFLGFGVGAGVIAAILWIGGPAAALLSGSWAAMLAGFAVISLAAWVALRRLLGITRSQVKTFDEDINDN
jgi:membrane protein implicated in regulation of membrane protease activity